MQNSLEHNFLGLTRAIMQDIIAYKPSHRKELERDYNRLVPLCSKMGARIFLDTLPGLRKQLDSSLSNSRLLLSGPLTRPYKKDTRIPRLFRGMWMEIFELDGSLKQVVDPNFVLFFRCLLNVGNKYDMKCPDSALFAETREFYNNDVTLPPPSQVWDGDGSDLADNSDVSLIDLLGSETDQPDLLRADVGIDTKLLATVQRVADMVAASLGLFNPNELSYRHGRGAVADGLRGKDKYLPRRWSARLSRVFSPDGLVQPLHYPHNYSEHEYHSVLEAVPKTIKGPRLIAKEPVDHMVCQLGIMDRLYDDVGRNPFLRGSIDFRNQDYSRQLALDSSRDKRMATIDLKSASDRISCWLIERLFRRNHSLLEMLISSRTRYISLQKDKKLPSLHKLRKFSTQGSAVTFPIQSIVFATLCVGAVAPHSANAKDIRKLFRNVRVYGDDIIVPVAWLEPVKALFSALYLRINTTKTHSQGWFRESCGMDAFQGHDVTPVNISRFLGQSKHCAVQQVIDASNNFYKKGLWHTADYLLSTVPAWYRDKIPVRRTADVPINLISFLGDGPVDSLKKRWNPYLQVEQYLILTKKVKTQLLEVDGSRGLSAFLMRAAYGNRDPYLGMVPEITFASRWETRESISRGWITLSA